MLILCTAVRYSVGIDSLEEAKKCICHAGCFISVKSYWLFQHRKHITLNSGLYDSFLIASILEKFEDIRLLIGLGNSQLISVRCLYSSDISGVSFYHKRGKKLLRQCTQNTVTLDNKKIHIPSPPLYSKLGCLLFFTSNSNSGTTLHG